ncbi:hypothetical protein PWT90_03973 [Aphanocladium album]|nr:hypothetical protein PWT90_03973 [Aphanocladium album]
MRYFSLLSVAFASAAVAQSDGFIAAVFYGEGDYELDIEGDKCVNLKKSQPIFYEIEVGVFITCKLYKNLKCEDEVKSFHAGVFDVEDLSFKSVRCTPSTPSMEDAAQ